MPHSFEVGRGRRHGGLRTRGNLRHGVQGRSGCAQEITCDDETTGHNPEERCSREPLCLRTSAPKRNLSRPSCNLLG